VAEFYDKWRKYKLKESYVLGDDYYDKTIEQFFEQMKEHADKTFIFFDTETTGLSNKTNQLTEIGAIAAEADHWQFRELDIENFYEKIALSPVTKYRMKKSKEKDPKFALKLTKYGVSNKDFKAKHGKDAFQDEKETLIKFFEFVESQENPILAAQNAKFDIDFVNQRAKQLKIGKSLDGYPIFDTMILLKMFHNPMIKTLADQGHPRAEKILKAITKVGKWGGKPYVSASMGPVSDAYEVDVKDWHNAIADVKMMMVMTQHVFNALIINSQTDIEKYHSHAVYGLKKKNKKK